MAFSISEVLYDWMHEKRIVSAVAQEMGVKDGTMSAQLRPSNTQAKLGADELIPLFRAIRKIGYGKELDGIVHRFIDELRNPDTANVPDEDMVSQVLVLASGLGTLSSCASRISSISSEAELTRLCTMLRTEILPIVLKMDDTIARRIAEVRRSRKQPPETDLEVEPALS